MIKPFLTLLGALLSVGCADHALQHRGTESIAYQEQHRFELSFESDDKKIELDRIESIVNQFDLRKARFELSYPTQYEQQALSIVEFMYDMKIRPDWVSVFPKGEESPFVLTVYQWQSVIDQCKPITITKSNPQAGCTVEANRTIQLINPGSRVN
ncbi:hypothetical protein JCM19231_4816 [Vibrio ishigakensis]|uniref:Uncharacterized protein n=1 Tax=Vibrio ishigakensis TaxID=1481914 RepID=A0A0B8P2M4_9VIBR|nr:hypothetical protein [Vibrio ishigakensis]GAM58832.1 hypothetical protein JCM19231_4816 [Vibrio ishigakensis]